MACPFFLPTSLMEASYWPHPARLPLGAGWKGECGAPGHEGSEPAEDDLRESCNLGYAVRCPRLPLVRTSDAVRFSITRDQGSRLSLGFVCELGHLPAAFGTLEYDCLHAVWLSPHPDRNIQKMADCYLQTYLQRRPVTLKNINL